MKPTDKLVFVSLVPFFILTPLAFAQAEIQQGIRNPEPPAATQLDSNATAKFEVASVRLSPPDRGLTTINNSGSPRFAAHGATMTLLIGLAFGLSSGNITGAPKWVDSQLYDVDAKAAGDAPLTPKEFQPLLQQLLKDRFHLAAHRETIYRPGYSLVVAKNGPRLQPGESASRIGYIANGGFRFDSTSMEAFAGVLSSAVGSPVTDNTGLKGEYNISLKFAPFNATDSTLPSIFTALEEDLGLKLVPDKKVASETLVIDHAERIPTEN